MIEIVPAGDSLREAALALVYQHLERDERTEQLSQMQLAANSGEITLDDLLVALVDNRPVGAVLAVRKSGRMAFVWPPVVVDEAAEVALPLMRHLVDRLDQSGVEFAQCLLEPDNKVRPLLSACDFPYCTDVLLLARPVSLPFDRPCVSFSTVPYDEARHAVFAEVMARTFVGSLDCPALAQHRSGEAALTTHRDTDPFDQTLWELVYMNGTVVGLILCSDHPERRVREIAYLGVVPEARGQGIGRGMLCRALDRAQRDDRDSLEIAVDACNRFALEIYRNSSFSVHRRMAVHLRIRSDNRAAEKRSDTLCTSHVAPSLVKKNFRDSADTETPESRA